MGYSFKHLGGTTLIGSGTYKFKHVSYAQPVVSYLTFQSTTPFALNVYDNVKHWDGSIEYSTDTTNWATWSGTNALNSINNKLYLRGTENTVITGSSANYRWVLTGSNIECIGNIGMLLDYQTVLGGNNPSMSGNCFRSLFQNCTSLIKAPELEVGIGIGCFSNMFNGCTSLTEAPSLPSTELKNNCYNSMFKGCVNLIKVPYLPATTLMSSCYYMMFYGCSSLKVSSTRVSTYQYPWRIPKTGTGVVASSWNYNMIKNTGGTFTTDPAVDTTYYLEYEPA